MSGFNTILLALKEAVESLLNGKAMAKVIEYLFHQTVIWLCLFINKHWEIFFDFLLFHFTVIWFRMAFGVIVVREKVQ